MYVGLRNTLWRLRDVLSEEGKGLVLIMGIHFCRKFPLSM